MYNPLRLHIVAINDNVGKRIFWYTENDFD